MTPYETDKIIDAVNGIFNTCLTINGMEKRTRDKTGDKPTAFINYLGHTNAIYLQIAANGWQEGETADNHYAVDAVVYLNDNGALKTLEKIQAVINQYLPGAMAEKAELEAHIDERRAELEKLYEEYTRRFPNADDL